MFLVSLLYRTGGGKCCSTTAELPFSQIGELFGKTESWARVTYFRARRKLKEEFDGT